MHRNLATVALALAGLFTTSATAGNTHYVEVNGDIQTVIDNAETGATIQLAAGQYDITTPLDPGGKAVTILGTVDGNGDPTSILDGGNPVGGTSGVRVLICQSGETSATVFENLVIQNGYDSSDTGGGMLNVASSPTLTNCTFTTNTGDRGGGGMHNRSSSNPTLTDCTFTNNSGGGFGGGGMVNSDSSPTLTNCAFTNNSALYGGGMHNIDSSSTLTNCTFTSNTSSSRDGGGMVNEGGNLTLTGCTFTSNSAEGAGGGMVNYESSPTLNDCTFTNNSAAGDGGAIYCLESSSPTLTDCYFCGNLNGSGFNSISGDAIDGSSSGNTFNNASCADADEDGVPDVWDVCSNGDDTIDSDGDGTPDACDNCPDDPDKTEPGNCGCGVVETTLAGDLDCDGDYDEDDARLAMTDFGITEGTPGDMDGDDDVDAADFVAVRDQIGVDALGCLVADINGDGEVDGADFAYVLGYWGVCSAP